jgi:CyaY protein
MGEGCDFRRAIRYHVMRRSPLKSPGAHAMTTDTEFIAAADVVLVAIGVALDRALAQSDADVDWGLNDGILEIDAGDSGKLIVNRHVHNREIWVAARAGGFHFRAEGGRWRDTRSGEELLAVLARLLLEQTGLRL